LLQTTAILRAARGKPQKFGSIVPFPGLTGLPSHRIALATS
jgi:hypothetical protein